MMKLATKCSRHLVFAAVAAFANLAAVPAVLGQEAILYPATAALPSNEGVVVDGQGNVFLIAGADVMELTPPSPGSKKAWGVRILAILSSQAFAYNGVIQDAGGNLYGSATTDSFGGGEVFEIKQGPPGQWTEKILYTTPYGDRTFPYSTLALDSAGNIYGASYAGRIFELTRPSKENQPWSYVGLFNLSTISAAGPVGITLDAQGRIFGTTLQSTQYPAGVAFKLTPPSITGGSWSEQTLYSFSGRAAPSSPTAQVKAAATPCNTYRSSAEVSPVLDAAGNLYATRPAGGANGCGYVFELSPTSSGSWTLSILYSFGGGTDGATPAAGVTLDNGILYGTTVTGGSLTGPYDISPYGTVFSLTPPSLAGGNWTETVLHRFTSGFDGSFPGGRLTVYNGALYGATMGGGLNTGYAPLIGDGVVFRVVP